MAAMSTAGRGYTIDLKNPGGGFTKLHRASWLGNIDEVRNCLKSIPASSKDENMRTPLHLAAAAGNTNIAVLLMTQDLNFNDRDKFGKTAIMKAIECSNKETAKAMIAKGVDLTATDHNGSTAMHMTLRQGYFDIAQLMLQYFPNCNLTDVDGISPLHILAEGMNIKLVRKFFDHGALIDVVDNRGRTPLMIACKRGCFPMVSLFLKHGANTEMRDCNGWTAMDYASIMGHTQICAILEKYTRGEISNEKDSESSLSEDEDEDALNSTHPLLTASSQRVVPIRIESETMFLKRQERERLQRVLDKKGSAWDKEGGVRNEKGELFPMPHVIASLQAQGNKLGDIYKWLLNHQEQLNQKAKDRDELKKHAKKLWEERKKLLSKLEVSKNKVKVIGQKIEDAPSIKETDVLQQQVDTLTDAFAELKEQYDKIVAEKEELQLIYTEGSKTQKSSDFVLKEKAEQLIKENDALYRELAEIQSHTREVTGNLSKKCKAADDLVANLKILLRGTYKLLEEKHRDMNRVMNEVEAQQQLITKTKDNCLRVKEENIAVGKNIEDVDNRMKLVRKQMGKIHRELESYPLIKSLIDAGVIESPQKPPEELKKRRFFCCRKEKKVAYAAHELKPESEVSQLASKKIDPSELMSPKLEAPTVCETTMEQVRYSWMENEESQIGEISEEDMQFITGDDDHTVNSDPADDPGVSSSNVTQGTSDGSLPAHLKAKLAVVAAKYSN